MSGNALAETLTDASGRALFFHRSRRPERAANTPRALHLPEHRAAEPDAQRRLVVSQLRFQPVLEPPATGAKIDLAAQAHTHGGTLVAQQLQGRTALSTVRWRRVWLPSLVC